MMEIGPQAPGRHAGSAPPFPRRLRPPQAARRDRILDAAEALAAGRGHEELAMGAVAGAAGVSRATLYRYFASRDHLLGEVTLRWGHRFLERLRGEGARESEHASGVLAAIVAEAAGHPELIEAAVAALMSRDPAARSLQPRVEELLAALLSLAGLEAASDADRTRLEALGRLLFASLVLMTTGRRTPAEVTRELATYAALLAT